MEQQIHSMRTNNLTSSDIHELVKLPLSYKFRACLAIAGVVLFFILYLALVGFFGFLLYYSITYEVTHFSKWNLFAKIATIAGSSMLLLFTLKFILKIKNEQPKNRVKLNMTDHPKLQKFIDDICAQTKAPKPKNVFVDPDVNAYVSYNNLWLSLLFPTKKNLTIGLGLVDCVNHTEFKAVVAHEFGHFAQRSMKIGSYIISANTIIRDMIFSRDKWDTFLDNWRAIDLRLSAPAWILTPIVWLIRQLLNLFYQFLNIMYSSLSREMEFNADKVAVSTTGSDAILSALWKLEYGNNTWNDTLNNMYHAAQKDQRISNLYVHNKLNLTRLEPKTIKAHSELETCKEGGLNFFPNHSNSTVNMYATHPSNDARQKNVKTPFVKTDIDHTSPWELFGKQDQIQTAVTDMVYEQYLAKSPASNISPEEFEDYIQAENEGIELLEEYQNTFANRFLSIPKKQEIKLTDLIDDPKEQITSLKEMLRILMNPIDELTEQIEFAHRIANGLEGKKSLVVNGKEYPNKKLEEGYNILIEEREVLYQSTFEEWDHDFCMLYLTLAKDSAFEEELNKTYFQHQLFSSTYQEFLETRKQIATELNGLQSRSEVSEAEISAFGKRIRKTTERLNTFLDKLNNDVFVRLPNIDSVDEMRKAIVDDGIFRIKPGNMFENGEFDKFINDLERAINHAQRIDQKSIIAILKLHKKLEGLKN